MPCIHAVPWPQSTQLSPIWLCAMLVHNGEEGMFPAVHIPTPPSFTVQTLGLKRERMKEKGCQRWHFLASSSFLKKIQDSLFCASRD